MPNNYTTLDDAIIARIADGGAEFASINAVALRLSKTVAIPTPTWPIVDRRLQALRKAGRIRYQTKPNGWVLA